FDRWSTAGHTPADVALTSKLFAEWPNGNDFDTLDTLTALLSDPQNATIGLFQAGCETGNQDPIGTSFDPGRFDGIVTGGDPIDGETSWTDEIGVTAGGDFTAPYRTPLAAFDDFELVIDTAQRDRRRYFQRRLTKGGLSLDRYDQNGEIWKNPARFGLENIPTRQFANGDELELRMFAGNGYGPIVSRLERTIERPWGASSVGGGRYRYNPLRSTLTRAENVSRSFVNDICAGQQLDAEQLLFDTRHRMTTYSATRNELVPLHQRPTPLYVAGWIDPSRQQMNTIEGYAFGRITNRFSQADVLGTYRPLPPNGELSETEQLLRDFSEKSYQDRSLKLDLRAALDGPITAYESALYTEDPDAEGFLLFPHQFFNPLSRIAVEDRFMGDLREGLWPGQADIQNPGDPTTRFKDAIELDREIRFRQRLESILAAELASAIELDPVNFPDEFTFQSYLQDQYENVVGGQNNPGLEAFLRSSQMAASWTANIDSYRDAKRRNRVQVWDPDSDSFVPIYLDQPIWPEDAPVMPDLQPDFSKRLVGMEPQPFLMESFFALVYPPSRFDDKLERDVAPSGSTGQNFPDADKWIGSWTVPEGDGIDWDPSVDEGSKWFDEESEPAIVFAIQIANPYEVPVPLHDLEIQIGDNPVGIAFARGLPSPHPTTQNNRAFYQPEELYLGPTLPDAPRTAIIFGVIPPSGIGGINNVVDARWLTRSPDENGDGDADDPAFMFFDPEDLGDSGATAVISPT
ncbi:MAG: hypothetical protein GY895_16170, partial [Phycisphaera sp.]|nr:hypothetical protein [Phycisphaera sp.]